MRIYFYTKTGKLRTTNFRTTQFPRKPPGLLQGIMIAPTPSQGHRRIPLRASSRDPHAGVFPLDHSADSVLRLPPMDSAPSPHCGVCPQTFCRGFALAVPIHYILNSGHCLCTFRSISIQFFIKSLHSMRGMCFHLFLDFISICYWPYDFTAICTVLLPLPFLHFHLESFPLPFLVSQSLCFAQTFSLHYTFATRKRMQSHALHCSPNLHPRTNALIRLNAYTRLEATVFSPKKPVVLQLQGFFKRMSKRERFLACRIVGRLISVLICQAILGLL